MISRDLILQSRRVVTPEGILDAVVVVREGKIAEVTPSRSFKKLTGMVDVGDKLVLPGLVDCHAHINDPGRADWEGFHTATRAAAAGGITTVVDMPLNSIPATTTFEALEEKERAAYRNCAIDYAFWGGVVPGNEGELERLIQGGVTGFKCFLIDSGVEEFKHVTREDLDRALPILARHKLPLIVHAELAPDGGAAYGAAGTASRAYREYLGSRPRQWENDAVRLMIDLCRKHRAQIHIVHLSSADALEDIRKARAEGLPFTAETCPHYLTFAAEEIPDGATHFKCAPPIREKENRERLWRGLEDGTIDMIVSDHSPCTPKLKHLDQGDFAKAWGGIASLQFSLPAVWTGMRQRGISVRSLARWMCEAPAKLTGLAGRKGAITVGADGDLVVFDENAEFEVQPQAVLHRHSVTPYAGQRLFGKVELTFLRGQKINEGGKIIPDPRGIHLRRGAP